MERIPRVPGSDPKGGICPPINNIRIGIMSPDSELRKTLGEGIIPLFAIDERDRIHVINVDERVEPEANWSVVSLVPQAD